MKIHQSEIDAAHRINNERGLPMDNEEMREILEAALKVRRARKQAKRERQCKEKDKQVVESVKPSDARMSDLSKAFYEASKELALKPSNVERAKNFLRSSQLNAVMSTPSKATEWDGTFREGEAYQMRNGYKAYVRATRLNELVGDISGVTVTWPQNGKCLKPNAHDLIRPWPKGEQ